jgi:hypothetical protein
MSIRGTRFSPQVEVHLQNGLCRNPLSSNQPVLSAASRGLLAGGLFSAPEPHRSTSEVWDLSCCASNRCWGYSRSAKQASFTRRWSDRPSRWRTGWQCCIDRRGGGWAPSIRQQRDIVIPDQVIPQANNCKAQYRGKHLSQPDLPPAPVDTPRPACRLIHRRPVRFTSL